MNSETRTIEINVSPSNLVALADENLQNFLRAAGFVHPHEDIEDLQACEVNFTVPVQFVIKQKAKERMEIYDGHV